MNISHVRILHDRFPTREHYPFNLDILNTTDSIALSRPVTFFIGENGTGKSTLLRAIAQGCGIYLWEESQRRRFHNNEFENDLHTCLELAWTGERVPGSFFSSETFRYFAEVLDEWAAADPGTLDHVGGESLMEKSHGLRHAAYFTSHFRNRGLYLLDEPENALSPKMQIRLLKIFQEIGSIGNAQFIISTHSPILLAYPDAEIYSFDRSTIERVAYEETDYFRIYRDFLNDYPKYLREIQG
jgi:predicted ATPase